MDALFLLTVTLCVTLLWVVVLSCRLSNVRAWIEAHERKLDKLDNHRRDRIETSNHIMERLQALEAAERKRRPKEVKVTANDIRWAIDQLDAALNGDVATRIDVKLSYADLLCQKLGLEEPKEGK